MLCPPHWLTPRQVEVIVALHRAGAVPDGEPIEPVQIGGRSKSFHSYVLRSLTPAIVEDASEHAADGPRTRASEDRRRGRGNAYRLTPYGSRCAEKLIEARPG